MNKALKEHNIKIVEAMTDEELGFFLKCIAEEMMGRMGWDKE